MKVLIFGLGSIGQRWARILRDNSKYEVHAFRRRNLNLLIASDLQSVQESSLERPLNVIAHHNEKEIPDDYFDLAIIASPIGIHLADTNICIDKKIPKVLIEKPMFSLNEFQASVKLERIEKAIEKGALEVLVGYQNRYHPFISRLKQILKEGHIGTPQYVRTEYAEYLPSMHPYEDYRSSHMARKEEGGGPILCLSHEIDLAQYLFGPIDLKLVQSSKFGILETDVPDSILLGWKQSDTKLDSNCMSGDIYLDFLARPMRRSFQMSGSDGTIKYDWVKGELQVLSITSGYFEENFSSTERNSLFLSELNYFLTNRQSINRQLLEIRNAKVLADISRDADII
jgi:predicted dehydrogenase